MNPPDPYKGLGGTHEGSFKDASVNAADVSAKASPVEFSEQFQWEFPDWNLLGEITDGKLVVKISGMVGAEAKAPLSAKVRRHKPSQPKVDPDALTGGIDIDAGAVYPWKKQDESAYRSKLGNSAALLIDTVTMGNPALGWVLRQMGADAATEQVLKWLFIWGSQGTVPIIGLEALVEGSAGVGGKVHANAGFKSGKLAFTYGANATWGLGGQVKLMLDAVEGMKFALIVGGELRPIALDQANGQINSAITSGLSFANHCWNRLTADDRAREAVANGVHKIMPPKQRAHMIDNMRRGVCGDEDEDAILKILQYSERKGDLGSVWTFLGGSRKAASDLLWAMDGQHDARLRKLLDRNGVRY